MKKMQKSIFRKIALACMVLLFGTQVFAQGRIELNPSSKGVQISESSFSGFNSTFSFSSLESNNVMTEAGELDTKAPYNIIVNNKYAENAIK